MDSDQIGLTNSGKYYIRNEAAISEIVSNVREGYYCIILGSRYCQKSLLLRDVKTKLEAAGDKTCVLLNLQELNNIADSNFLPRFADMVNRYVQEQTKIAPPVALSEVTDEPSLQCFLQNYVLKLKQNLVLLIDHLEHIRIGPLEALLRVLRAVNAERIPNVPYRLIVVVTSSSPGVTEPLMSQTSPFTRRVWVRDLTSVESKRLIECILVQQGIEIAPEGLERLLWATNGDRFLLRELCDHFSAPVFNRQGNRINWQEVSESVDWFVKEKADCSSPLRETVRAIEADPVTLMNVLKVLELRRVPSRELKLELETYGDKLQLSGAVSVEEEGNEKFYQIRNEIYYRHLKKHFHHERVGSVLTMAGQWEEAIHYLERVMMNDSRCRSTLLSVVVESIYDAQNESEAYKDLARRLSLAFTIPKVRIYSVNPERSQLILISQTGFKTKHTGNLSLSERDQPEVKAYFSQRYEVFQNPSGEQVLLVPLLRDRGEPVGLVVVHDFRTEPWDGEFLEFLAFLKQLGRAIEIVIDRGRRSKLLTSLHEVGMQITSRSLDLEQVVQNVYDALEKSLGAQRGFLFLWNEEQQQLIIEVSKGYRPTIAHDLRLRKGEGYVGKVYATGEPILIGNVPADPRVLYKEDPDIGKKQKSVICVPLEAWGRRIGVLCVDNITEFEAFREDDLEWLSAFADQAAIAIHNAQLYTALSELAIGINRGNLSPMEIFQQVVKSITRVIGAMKANMLLLRDTDNPQLSISQRPVLFASHGLGSDFDEHIQARPDGLTVRTLLARKPLAVTHPDEPPGINPLALQQGTRAYLCVPMMIQDAIIGVLFVHYDHPHAFSENEKQILSIFANLTALAIENARQREKLEIAESVVLMGIGFLDLAHQIAQKTSAIRTVVDGLRRLLEGQPEVRTGLDDIGKLAQVISEIPRRALLPFRDRAEPKNLNAVLSEEIPRRCMSEGVALDFSGLTTENTLIHVDSQRLAIVLRELTTNAVQAMRNSSQKKLTLRSEIRGERVVVEITNTGREIPEDVRNRLFKEPIPRAGGTGGSGVGLLIARAIMDHYDGGIELVRTKPGGTTFSLWLPLYRAPSE